MDHFRDQNALLAQRYDKSGPKWYFNDSFHRYPEEPADLDVAARVDLDGLVLKVEEEIKAIASAGNAVLGRGRLATPLRRTRAK